MKEELRESLKPLYTELLQKITTSEDTYSFCMQWGANFPKEKNTGILFVGKATNGWMSNSKDMELIFGNNKDRIFARHDQMKWVQNHFDDPNYKKGQKDYNARNSAFWRVIRSVTKKVHPLENWYSKVAWSNLYKVSFEEGNPDGKLKAEQDLLCKQILAKEIEILSPRFVVFLTSNWEWSFVKHLNGGREHKWISSHQWAGEYESKVCEVNGIVFICSVHPQGKNEYDHAKAIIEIIKSKTVM